MWINSQVRLLADAKTIKTKTGTAMTTAFVGTNVEGEDWFAFNLVAFGDLAGELSRYRRGSTLAVTGTLKANDYVRANGEDVKGFQVIADGLAGVKRQQPVQEERRPRRRQERAAVEEFNDAIEF